MGDGHLHSLDNLILRPLIRRSFILAVLIPLTRMVSTARLQIQVIFSIINLRFSVGTDEEVIIRRFLNWVVHPTTNQSAALFPLLFRFPSHPKAAKVRRPSRPVRDHRMELELEPRPLSMTRNSGWNEDGQLTSPQQAYYSHRRRSLAVPPPGPPPTQPIPSVPPYSPPSSSSPPPDYEASRSSTIYIPSLNGAGHTHDPYPRPATSTNLPPVPLHSQSNTPPTYRSSSHQSPPFTSPHSLSDSPPRSQLRPVMDPPHQEIVPDRLRLSPTNERSERRPSSRRALTRALELAREAVRLDSTNDDPYAAVVAYGRSVALLSEVMERVMRGEESTESHKRKNGRRRSVVAQEEEVRRLRSIVRSQTSHLFCRITDMFFLL